MRAPTFRLRTVLALLAGIVLSALAGLVMAAPNTYVGADLLGRWLVGWAVAATVLLPIAWSATQSRRRGRAPARAIVTPPFRTRRLG